MLTMLTWLTKFLNPDVDPDKESLTTIRAAMEQKYNIPTGDEEAARFVSESATENIKQLC
jgi:hypothetical protein